VTKSKKLQVSTFESDSHLQVLAELWVSFTLDVRADLCAASGLLRSVNSHDGYLESEWTHSCPTVLAAYPRCMDDRFRRPSSSEESAIHRSSVSDQERCCLRTQPGDRWRNLFGSRHPTDRL